VPSLLLAVATSGDDDGYCLPDLTKQQIKPMKDQHQLAADEVWSAFPPDLASKMKYDDFVLGFKLGRVSMKACFDKAELLRPDDEPKPFTPPTE